MPRVQPLQPNYSLQAPLQQTQPRAKSSHAVSSTRKQQLRQGDYVSPYSQKVIRQTNAPRHDEDSLSASIHERLSNNYAEADM